MKIALACGRRIGESVLVVRPSTRIERLFLAEVRLPRSHPRFVERSCPVFGYAICHPDGVILFDTGVGTGNELIDELYCPKVVSITAALEQRRIDERDVVAVVNSHLHFDHCGQNDVFQQRGVPTYVQAAEVAAARLPGYTVPDWARIPEPSLRMVHGDEVLVDGVTLLETTGHTPGHQSLVVDTTDGVVVVAGQCTYRIDELRDGRVALDNMHDDSFVEAGQQSLDRLRRLRPRSTVMAHDPRSWPTEPTRP